MVEWLLTSECGADRNIETLDNTALSDEFRETPRPE
jgi:hypothetical protein